MIHALLALIAPQVAPASSSDLALHRVGDATYGSELERVLLGNGRLAARVRCGTHVRIDLSHADARSESGRPLDLGSFEIDVQSTERTVWDRSLLLDEGRLRISYGHAQGGRTLELYVEPDRDILHVVGTVDDDAWVTVTAWSRASSPRVLRGEELRAVTPLENVPDGLEVRESADVFVQRLVDQLAMYHRNETSISTPARDGPTQASSDPLLDLTSGTWVEAPGFVRIRENAYGAEAMSAGSFHLRIAAVCVVTKDADSWIDRVAGLAASSADERAARERTAAWWKSHFTASRVEVAPPSKAPAGTDISIASRAYVLERWSNACTARFGATLQRPTQSDPEGTAGRETGARILNQAELAIATFRFPRAPETSRLGVGFVEELEAALVRTEGDALRMLPMWPAEWDVSFRIRVPGPTTIDGVWRDGAWVQLATEPAREILSAERRPR